MLIYDSLLIFWLKTGLFGDASSLKHLPLNQEGCEPCSQQQEMLTKNKSCCSRLMFRCYLREKIYLTTTTETFLQLKTMDFARLVHMVLGLRDGMIGNLFELTGIKVFGSDFGSFVFAEKFPQLCVGYLDVGSLDG